MEFSIPPIGARLKDFRRKRKVSISEIASLTGIPKENLYKWEKGVHLSNVEDYAALKLYLDTMENKIEGNDFLIDCNQPSTLRLPLNHDRAPVPQIDYKEAAGTIIVTENEPELIVDRINAPCLGKIEGIVNVTTDCMSPTIMLGSKIGIKRLSKKEVLYWGDYYYIIDINHHCTVKRIYADTGTSYKLVSDNPKYPPQIGWHRDILGILEVMVIIHN